jgi:hypothetical protein
VIPNGGGDGNQVQIDQDGYYEIYFNMMTSTDSGGTLRIEIARGVVLPSLGTTLESIQSSSTSACASYNMHFVTALNVGDVLTILHSTQAGNTDNRMSDVTWSFRRIADL